MRSSSVRTVVIGSARASSHARSGAGSGSSVGAKKTAVGVATQEGYKDNCLVRQDTDHAERSQRRVTPTLACVRPHIEDDQRKGNATCFGRLLAPSGSMRAGVAGDSVAATDAAAPTESWR